MITVNCDNSKNNLLLYYTLTSTKKDAANATNDLTNSINKTNLANLESQLQTVTSNACAKKSDKNNYRFALTGKVWSVIKDYYPELIPRICTRG